MKEKKNIDRIFQEKFKDFEAEPTNTMWEKISSKLDEKENKRKAFVIPLWMRLGAAAAVIAFIVASLLFIQNNKLPEIEGPGVVIEEDNGNPKPEEISDEGLIQTKGSIAEEQSSKEDLNKVKSNSLGEKKDTTKPETETSQFQNKETRIAKSFKDVATDKARNNYTYKNERIVSVTGNKRNSEKEVIKPEISKLKTSGLIADNVQIIDDSIRRPGENRLVLLEKKKKNQEEDLDEKEEVIAEAGNKKLRLSTFAAPVFYRNLGGGNELSTQFAGNPTSSEVTLAYGMKIAYQLSEKLKIRTGISKIDMNYNIGGISYSPVAVGTGFNNLNAEASNIQIRNDVGGSEMDFGSITQNSLSSSLFTPGEISQQFGFIEVPLELEYSLIDSRFSINLIGGGSSLFLDRNRVDLVAGNINTSLGEATNINQTSFSTNLGLGLDYKLNDLFSMSLEPIFKYQINTFNNVKNVRPANFGIYSGLNFRF